MAPEEYVCDMLVISPHTDDMEIGVGGTVALLTGQGRKIWALDLTRGELGSNAKVEERWQEAAEASGVLGLTGRIQLELPDGFVSAQDPEQVVQLVALLRLLQPRWVVTAPDPVRHPDHKETPLLVAKACFMARLASLEATPGPMRIWEGSASLNPAVARWEVEALLNVCPDRAEPDLVFDISAQWTKKMQALNCYGSQFQRAAGRKQTAINDPVFLQRIERRAQTWGRSIRVEYGEAFQTKAVAVFTDLPDQRWI